MNQPILPALIAAELARVDDIIQQRIAAQAAIVQAAGPQITAPQGPRLRAMLTLMVAQLGRSVDDGVLHAAAAVELIHTATTVHDTLIDDAERRRGVVADHNRWRGDISLMIGDYMFALAASEMALAPDPRIIDYFSRAVMLITESELTPVTTMSPPAVAIEQYHAVISGKSAALLEAAGKAGMICGGGSPTQIEALGRFGFQFGLAHRIYSDIATIGNDIQAGRITLPLIYAVEASGDAWLSQVIDAEALTEDDIRRAQQVITTHGGTARALADARQAAERALGALDSFPNSAAKQALIMFTSTAL